MAAALALYGLWVLTTCLMEGLPNTLLRPEAHGLRIAYTTVANLIVGTLGSMLLLRRLVLTGAVTAPEAGFGRPRRSVVSVTLGAVLGAAFLAAQDPPAVPLVVIINVFAQVLPVSIAEVLVCWSIIGSVAVSSVDQRAGRTINAIVLTAVASVAFGVYHVGHSPPFNSPTMIALLTAVGVVTSAVFLALRDVYGTVMFHNFLAVHGVLRTLIETGKVTEYATPMAPLLITGIGSVALLMVARMLVLRDATPRRQGLTTR